MIRVWIMGQSSIHHTEVHFLMHTLNTMHTHLDPQGAVMKARVVQIPTHPLCPSCWFHIHSSQQSPLQKMLVKIRSSNLWAHVSGDSRNTTCHFRGDFQGYLSFGDCWSSSCTCLELSRPGLVLPDLLHSLDNDAWIVDDFWRKTTV